MDVHVFRLSEASKRSVALSDLPRITEPKSAAMSDVCILSTGFSVQSTELVVTNNSPVDTIVSTVVPVTFKLPSLPTATFDLAMCR